MPGLVIGLTVVALGTSVPELAVSVSAALQGSNEIALSNVVGSNIFNLLVVLGSCALLHAVPVEGAILKRDFPVAIGSTVFVLLATSVAALFGRSVFQTSMTADVGIVNRLTGLILIVCFLVYIIGLPMWKCLLLILAGLLLVVIGGKAVVYGAREIAEALGMSETLIGLTIVAAGTSLPELVTSIAAAKKQQTGLAVGNAIGSNIFNLMFILGISAVIHPVAVNMASVYDMLILIAVTVVTMIFAIRGKSLNRWEGLIMILLYAADVAFAIVR